MLKVDLDVKPGSLNTIRTRKCVAICRGISPAVGMDFGGIYGTRDIRGFRVDAWISGTNP